MSHSMAPRAVIPAGARMRGEPGPRATHAAPGSRIRACRAFRDDSCYPESRNGVDGVLRARVASPPSRSSKGSPPRRRPNGESGLQAALFRGRFRRRGAPNHGRLVQAQRRPTGEPNVVPCQKPARGWCNRPLLLNQSGGHCPRSPLAGRGQQQREEEADNTARGNSAAGSKEFVPSHRQSVQYGYAYCTLRFREGAAQAKRWACTGRTKAWF